METEDSPDHKEPIFNLPVIIPVILCILAIVHLVRIFFLPDDLVNEMILSFAFIPVRYSNPEFWNYSALAYFWSPITYSFIHADWAHLFMNAFWLLAFGGVTAKRLGPFGFLVLFVLGAISGAGLHYIFHANDLSPVIGASASVSACMGAAVRLPVFSERNQGVDVSNMRIRSPLEALLNKQALTFILIWFAINLLFGTGILDITNGNNPIAWEAHIGGFLSGFFLLGFIDRLFGKP